MPSVLDRFKDRYSDHWHRVFIELLGIDEATLDGGIHDAPCCGAKAAFKASCATGGEVHPTCSACGGPDGRGGIHTHMAFVAKVLGVDRAEAKRRVDAFLGFEGEPAATRRQAPQARRSASDLLDRANGRWPQILGAVGGIGSEFLTGKHGPCPLCGDFSRPDSDRWRWDDHGGNGGGYCNQCGGKNGSGGAISGLDLIARARGITFAEACAAVDEHLGGEPVAPRQPTAKAATPWRCPERPPADAPPPIMGSATHQWLYEDAKGPCYWIQRIPIAGNSDSRGKTRKRFTHVVWLDGRWHFPSSKRDGFSCQWPEPRPLLGYRALIDHPDRPVLVVEGETTRDAATALLPDWVAITWNGGCTAVSRFDWQPLAGRTVVIWPDADAEGIKAAGQIAELLQGAGAASVAVVNPPPDAPKGWDLADAAADNWSAEQALALITAARAPEGEGGGEVESVEHGFAPADGSGDGSGSRPRGGEAPWPFTMLGFSGDQFFYQPGESGQVMAISRSAHSSSTNLLGLAPLEWWQDQFPRTNRDGEVIGIKWVPAANELFRRQYAVGCYDPSRIRGIGAWWDNDRVVFHLGDRLISDGKVHPVLSPPASQYLYQRLPRRDGPGSATPLSDAEGANLVSLAERFHWESKVSGPLLAGWCALAPICGALEWRPHLWLNAVAGSGKSSVFDYYVAPLITDLSLHVLGNTTEAGIRQKLRSDALPVVFDEAESNERTDASRMQGILALARASSSEGRGVTVKGSPSAEVTMFNVRSMFLLSSISTALKQGADRTRFSVLVLRIPDDLSAQAKADHWESLRADLEAGVSAEVGRRLVARMVGLAGVVRQTARTMARIAAIELGSARQGDQIGSLLAGAWCLTNQSAPFDAEALAYIQSTGISAQREGQGDERGGDQRDCLETILQSQLRVETGRDGTYTRTIAELIEVASGLGGPMGAIPAEIAVAALGRHGIRVEGQELLISNIAKGVAKLLAGSAWADGGWANLLAALPGARRNGMTRFKGLASATRAVAIPISLLG